jgi:hypothetical protein
MPSSSRLCTCSAMPALDIAAAISAALSVSAGTSERPAPPADGYRIARYGHGGNPEPLRAGRSGRCDLWP